MLSVARAKALGIVRMLLLALALQVVVPAFPAAMAVSAVGLQADIAASLCHSPSDTDSSAPARTAAKHCIFCLPLIGGVITPSSETELSTPMAQAIVLMTLAPGQRPQPQRHAIAHPRAPPVIAHTG